MEFVRYESYTPVERPTYQQILAVFGTAEHPSRA